MSFGGRQTDTFAARMVALPRHIRWFDIIRIDRFTVNGVNAVAVQQLTTSGSAPLCSTLDR